MTRTSSEVATAAAEMQKQIVAEVIKEIESLLGHIAGHMDFAKMHLGAGDLPSARQQLSEVEGWATSIIDETRGAQ